MWRTFPPKPMPAMFTFVLALPAPAQDNVTTDIGTLNQEIPSKVCRNPATPATRAAPS
jgi:hypothetical protein